MADYGIPYMGSKDKICDQIIKIFPRAENFYDLFGGGFSITHAMLLRRSTHYRQFHFNEIRPGICDLIQRAIKGEFNYNVFKPPFVSREEFSSKLETDAYIKIIWSFGNNGKDYIFSKEIEPYKKSMHNAIVFNEFDSLAKKVIGMDSFKDGFSINEKRLFLRNRIEHFRRTKIPEFLYPYLNERNRALLERADNLQQLQQLQQLERLQQLLQLERLQQLLQLQQLKFYNLSYELVPIKENSIIYCDPPYLGTVDYGNQFDHKKFYEWAANNKHPVFISEYNINHQRLKVVFKTEKRSMLSADKLVGNKTEKVYANQAAQKYLLKQK
jgi:site-specific DNA-adenine methylase